MLLTLLYTRVRDPTRVACEGNQCHAATAAAEFDAEPVAGTNGSRAHLAAHEDVKRVGELLAVRARHCVERSNTKGKLGEDIKVGSMQRLDELAERLLLLGVYVVEG